MASDEPIERAAEFTIDRLAKDASQPNPVNIAGYGKESTHQGYLSWLLSPRCPESTAIMESLVKMAGAEHVKFSSTVNSRTEVVVSVKPRRQIDIVVDVDDSSVFAIELKTDSGPSGDGQLKEMSVHTIGGKSVRAYLLLELGSASVMDFQSGELFKVLRPAKIVAALSHLREKDTVLAHWLEALESETARAKNCAAVYRSWQLTDKSISPTRWGYRSGRDLTFYILNCVREELKQIQSSGRWAIYSGGYNTVMCLYPPPDEHFLRETAWPAFRGGIGRPYFEFNDDHFILKCLNPQSDGSISVPLKETMKQIREEIGSISSREKDSRARPCQSRSKGNWLHIYKWELGLSDPRQTAADASDILNKYGYDGLLKDHLMP